LKRFDEGIARGEAVLATLFLLSMILSASIQAVFRNLAGAEIGWANDFLGYLTWVDPFLQKGTLWLAFLGASLATREGRHIGIDLFPRIAPKRVKLLMRGVAALGSSVVSFYLARAFWAAVLVNAEERPAHYEVYGDAGSLHVCDATAAQVADASLEVPSIFCSFRGGLDVLGVPVETPEAALQLIVPVMFIMMSVRLFANGVEAFLALRRGGEEIQESHHTQSTEMSAVSLDEAEGSDEESSDEESSDGDEDATASEDSESADDDEPDDDEPDDDDDESDDDESDDEKGEG
jgi:TRAP-type C4-dicarboxylate transport system permease small subunit